MIGHIRRKNGYADSIEKPVGFRPALGALRRAPRIFPDDGVRMIIPAYVGEDWHFTAQSPTISDPWRTILSRLSHYRKDQWRLRRGVGLGENRRSPAGRR